MSTKYNCGVYVLLNTVTGKVYVGSSVNIKNRHYGHIRGLRRNEHHSKKLQRSYNKHGEEAFKLYTVIWCDRENLATYEQIVMDSYSSYSTGYNEQPMAYTPRNYKLRAEHKANISKALKGKKKTAEHSAKVSAARKGRPANNPGPKSEETKEKIRQAIRAHWIVRKNRAKELVERLETGKIAREHQV